MKIIIDLDNEFGFSEDAIGQQIRDCIKYEIDSYIKKEFKAEIKAHKDRIKQEVGAALKNYKFPSLEDLIK